MGFIELAKSSGCRYIRDTGAWPSKPAVYNRESGIPFTFMLRIELVVRMSRPREYVMCTCPGYHKCKRELEPAIKEICTEVVQLVHLKIEEDLAIP
jgi:hypothetical protein